jgi:hypothetical protein
MLQISLFKAQFLVILFLKDFFPSYSKKYGSGRSLPFTVAGQQWIFTIFPSKRARFQPSFDQRE